METTLLLIDSFALLVVLLYSLKNERLPSGSPEQGWFRMKPVDSQPKRPAPPPRRSRVL